MSHLPVSRSMSPFDITRSLVSSMLDEWPRLATEGHPSRGGWFPMDVVETPEDYRVTAEVPGVPTDAVEVSLESNVLSIAVKKLLPSLGQDDSVHLRERAYGDFRRSITLPRDVNVEGVTADQKGGLLEIRLPKREEAKSRQISVRSGEE